MRQARMSTAKEADARMRHLELVGLSEDGTSVVLNDVETGESFGVQLDDRLRAAVVHDRVRLGQLELALTSTLRPKDIQARIRAGQSSADVAAAAGVSVERIMRFASPVLAEREHVATQAQRSVLRRPGSDAPRTLADVVSERLDGRHVPAASLGWDAWRRDDGRWTVSVRYRSGERERTAHFVYDPLARVVVTSDDESRWLAGEPGPLKGPQPRGRSERPDDERAVELANEGRALRLAPIESDDEADHDAGNPELFDGPFRRRSSGTAAEAPRDLEDDRATTSIPRIDVADLGPDEWSDLDEPNDVEDGPDEPTAAVTAAVAERVGQDRADDELLDHDPVAEEPVAEEPVTEPESRGRGSRGRGSRGRGIG